MAVFGSLGWYKACGMQHWWGKVVVIPHTPRLKTRTVVRSGRSSLQQGNLPKWLGLNLLIPRHGRTEDFVVSTLMF